MSKFGLLLFIFMTVGYAQQSLYEQAYERANQDSVITSDEQQLLDLFSVQSDTTTSDTSTQSSSDLTLRLNQEGRWRLIYSTMAVGNSLYGIGIPYLLDAEKGRYYLGFQFLAAAGGFYAAYNKTQDMDLSIGRVSLIEEGATLAFMSFFPLQALVGVQNWRDFDSQGKVALSYAMLSIPAGAYFGNRLYERWRPSDGQAMLINIGSGLGAMNGLAAYRLLLGDYGTDSEKEFNTAYRIAAGAGFGGALLGLKYGHHFAKDRSISIGDAYFIQGSAVLGFYVGVQTIRLANLDSERPIILVGMAAINSFIWQSEKMIDDVDLTTGDAVIVALGVTATNGIWRGLAIMGDVDLASELSAGLDIATSMIGYVVTTRSVVSKRKQKPIPGPQKGLLGLKFSPAILGDLQRPVPGFNIQISFN